MICGRHPHTEKELRRHYRPRRITVERITVPAPGRAVVFVHDGGAKALKAFGLVTR